jgi:hypothetical protein
VAASSTLSDPDRLPGDLQAARDHLPRVKAARAARPDLYPADFDWAVAALEDALAEVERLREWQDRIRQDRTTASVYYGNVEADRNRLRGLLARLEWVGAGPVRSGSCPACGAAEGDHDPDCWLAAELGRNDESAPPPG